MINQLQQNVYEKFKILQPVPGWGVLEQDGLLALKSPLGHAFFNFMWGTAAPAPIARAKAFYDGQPFTWLLDEGADHAPLLESGFTLSDTLPDMVFQMEGYAFPGQAPGITCIRAYGSHDLRTWAVTAGEAFGLDAALFRDFYLPMVRQAGCVPILALCDGVPAATAMAFCGAAATGIYTVGTREPFRRRGLARSVVHACLRLAQHHGSQRAMLSASSMGLPVYAKMGFRVERTMREYVHQPSARQGGENPGTTPDLL
jgi:GNAT superfamily N-acetyltransferase